LIDYVSVYKVQSSIRNTPEGTNTALETLRTGDRETIRRDQTVRVTARLCTTPVD